MQVITIKTHKITSKDKDIVRILDKYLSSLEEDCIVAVTSKIISITQGRTIKIDEAEKDDLVMKESDYYMPRRVNKYNSMITIKNSILIPAAGIDESNGNGYYILWPENPQKEANRIRKYLLKRFGKKNIGVIITDSHTTFGRKGTIGVCIGYSGFHALNNYIGKKDVFGRALVVTQADVPNSLAAIAVAVMGEGKEQTPIAIIKNPPFVKFTKANPSKKEKSVYIIKPQDDLYGFIIEDTSWKKGDRGIKSEGNRK